MVALLISNISATKLIALGPIIVDGGVILFPLTYILGDILTEVYGYKYARRAIWLAFATMLFGVVIFTIVKTLPPAPDYTDQSSFEAIFGFYPRIVVASLAAFLIGLFVNSFILAKLKAQTKGKWLGLRLIASTAVGSLLDMISFALVAFGGILSASDLLIYIAFGWVLKVGVEAILLPVTCKIISLIKKSEKVDIYDLKTNFNPFKVSVRR